MNKVIVVGGGAAGLLAAVAAAEHGAQVTVLEKMFIADSFYTEFPFNSMSFHRNAPSSIYTILSA